MKKKQKQILFFSILAILLLTSSVLSILLIQEDKKSQNTKSIYCVLKGEEKDKTEVTYHFKNKKVSQILIVTEQPFTQKINVNQYQKKMDENHRKYKGVLNKIWYDDSTFRTMELFDLEFLTEKELKELTGFSKKEIQKKTRQQLMDSILVMGKNATLKCE